MYINAKKAMYIREILDAFRHKQPQTPVQINNSVAVRIVTKKVVIKAMKAMNMCFH